MAFGVLHLSVSYKYLLVLAPRELRNQNQSSISEKHWQTSMAAVVPQGKARRSSSTGDSRFVDVHALNIFQCDSLYYKN